MQKWSVGSGERMKTFSPKAYEDLVVGLYLIFWMRCKLGMKNEKAQSKMTLFTGRRLPMSMSGGRLAPNNVSKHL